MDLTTRKLKLIVAVFYSLLLAVTNAIAAQSFDLNQANHVLHQANLHIKQHDINLGEMRTKLKQIHDLNEQAEACIQRNEKKISQLERTVKLTQKYQLNHQSTDVRFLKRKEESLIRRFSDCRLFHLKATDTIEQYHLQIDSLASGRLFKIDKPIWDVFINKHFYQNPFMFDKHTKINHRLSQMGLGHWLSLLGIVLLSLLVLVKLRTVIFRLPIFSYLYQKDQTLMIKVFISLLTVFLATTLYFNFLFDDISTPSLVESYSYLGLGLFFAVSLSSAIINLRYSQELLKWFEVDGRFFERLTWAFWFVFFLFAFVDVTSRELSLSQVQLKFLESCLIFTVIAIAYFIVHYFLRSHTHFNYIQSHKKQILKSVKITLTLCMIIDWIGLHQFSMFLVISLCKSFAYLLIATILFTALTRVYKNMIHRTPLALKLKYYLGVAKNKEIFEIQFLNVLFKGLLFFYLFVAIVSSWDLSTYTDNELLYGFRKGFHIWGFNLIPRNVVVGSFVFCALNLGVRFVSTMISRLGDDQYSRESQSALGAIVMYFGFLISAVTALVIAGVNFTGLAIVAGALSVGIGLGLKGIINNFVCGIILLLERPIRSGDRIIVDDIEGIVQRVRVRATLVRTRSREDVLIPNETFITSKVVNYMYQDQIWRLSCEVGVSYDSDVELVKKVLYDVAASHPDVIQEAPHKPSVLLTDFGDFTYNFVLRVVIKDVNRKRYVQSDLNFEIVKQFDKHGIVIPAPQRELFIKEDLTKPQEG